jgi:hypothetical protein
MGRNPDFPGTVRTVVFLLSVLAVIVALHLLHREKARYCSGVGIVFAYVVIVSLALGVGGYTIHISFNRVLEAPSIGE